MAEVSMKSRRDFRVSGKSCWISGQDNDQFAAFWQQCHEDGTVDALKATSSDPAENCTGSRIFGVSRVEKDPNNRAFTFFIASECDGLPGYDSFTVPAAEWAVFSCPGEVKISGLIDAELYAFMEWLPASGYVHALCPEMEVYPEKPGAPVEFWLPVCKKAE